MKVKTHLISMENQNIFLDLPFLGLLRDFCASRQLKVSEEGITQCHDFVFKNRKGKKNQNQLCIHELKVAATSKENLLLWIENSF